MSLGFVMSGQGSHYAGMGKELYEARPAFREIFDRADEALGFSLSKLTFEEGSALDHPINGQPAIFTLSMAALALMQEEGVTPAALAGLSLGEYGALCAAGAYDFETGVRLVRRRGDIMSTYISRELGGMTAIMNLAPEEVEKACKDAGGDVYVANYNTTEQLVISGRWDDVKRAGELCLERGAKRVIPLEVMGPLHTPVIHESAEELHKELSKITFGPFKTPVYGNVFGARIPEGTDIPDMLKRHMMNPVRWYDCVNAMAADGVDTFIELGPKKTLSQFISRTCKSATVLNVEDLRSLEKTLEKIRG